MEVTPAGVSEKLKNGFSEFMTVIARPWPG
jgi:hypothetical protein